MALRVGFDVTVATSKRPRGMANYVFELLPALERAAPEIEPVLFLRDDRWFRRDRIAHLAPGAERRWMVEPMKAPLRGLDVFHGMGTRLPVSSRVPRTFTLHDLRGIDDAPEVQATNNRDRKIRTIRRADRILVLTEFGADRLVALFPEVRRESVTVVGHGVDLDRFRPHDAAEHAAVRAALGLPERFLLQLGSFFPHKNLEASIEGFARSGARSGDTALVLAGGGGSEEYRASLMERVERHGLAERVRWIDHVPAEHLAPLVSAARAVLMPSRYEGYGMPILEAMAAGTAGVASTSTCLPEVSAGIWDACDPDDADAWALAIDRLVGEE
ncbi:MAG: glycosyltransferase family 1 protein, partial [Planctomycetota bacterium]